MKRYSRRETEILEALYRLGGAAVGEIQAELEGKPSYDTVRLTLRVLERKGAVSHRTEGRRFVYDPVVDDSKAWKLTAQRLAEVFFGGSLQNAALAMLKISNVDLTDKDLDDLERKIVESQSGGERR